jgi:hypothetical protein
MAAYGLEVSTLNNRDAVSCSHCGKPAWVPFHRVVDDEGEFEEDFLESEILDRQRRPLTLSPEGPLCKRCWNHEWYVTGQTYVETLKTKDRGPCRTEGLAPFNDPTAEETDESKPPPAKFKEFMCRICLQMRPKHQRPNDDDNRCVDCDDGGPLPDWQELSKCPEPPRRWWHCEWCRSAHLAALICELEFTGLESNRFYQVGRLVSVTRLPKRARQHWADLQWQWSALCPLCGLERRNEAWVLREHAHRKCRNEQLRRQSRNRYVAIKSRSEPTYPKPVVQLWDNGIEGREPSVRAVNGSAPVPVFVCLHPQPLSTPEGTAL